MKTENMHAGIAQHEETAEDYRGNEEIVLVFNLFGENYALDVNLVREIVRVPPIITRVPNASHYVRGVINLRGTVIPVMDISQKMGGEPQEITPESRIVVAVLDEDVLFGFLVDAVREVSTIWESQIESADASMEASVDKKYLRGVAKADDGRLIVLLDLASLFELEEGDEKEQPPYAIWLLEEFPLVSGVHREPLEARWRTFFVVF